MRHGEAENNIGNRPTSSRKGEKKGLTNKGKEDVIRAAKNLKNFDMIISSPLMRTRETAEIICKTTGFDTEKIILDDRLIEYQYGVFDGRPLAEYEASFPNTPDLFVKGPQNGETMNEVRRRR
jgi:broad specificity phosphatase PhoE